MRRTPEIGTIYLIHFSHPLKHARHYLGWTHDGRENERLREHISGQGAKICAAASRNGAILTIVATLPGSRDDERRYKKRHNHAQFCPLCQEGWKKRRKEYLR